MPDIRNRRGLEDEDMDDAVSEISGVNSVDGVLRTKSEIEDEASPLAKARLLSSPTDRSIARARASVLPAPERRRAPKPAPNDPDLRDRVREIEDQVFSWSSIYDTRNNRGRPEPDLETPKTSSTLSPEDAIRNKWLLEKSKEGVTVATLIPDHVPQKESKIEEINFLKVYGLTPKDLATWIRDPRFAKLSPEPDEERMPREIYRDPLPALREHFEIRTIKGPDGTMIERPVLVVPPTRSHRRKSGAKVPLPVKAKEQPKKRALKDRERKMYLDYADGILSVEQMIAKHGTWTDGDILALELKIIRHAERAGLFVVPVQSKPGPVELDDSAEVRLTLKSGGGSLGTIHKRTRDSFATGPVRESDNPPGRKNRELPEWDDYSEDSAA